MTCSELYGGGESRECMGGIEMHFVTDSNDRQGEPTDEHSALCNAVAHRERELVGSKA